MPEAGKSRPHRAGPDLPTLAGPAGMYALSAANVAPHAGRPLLLLVHVGWLTPLVLGHDHHAIHHPGRNIPWYRYRGVFRERLDAPRRNGVPIEHRVFARRFRGRELPSDTAVPG